MSDCRFGVSPVNYPDPDPDPVDQLESDIVIFCISSMLQKGQL